MKIQIENLRAQMRGVQLNSYQRALALDEYYKLLDYVEELEQLTIPAAEEEIKANAQLTAAAPDLLEALKMCWASLQTYGDHQIIDMYCEKSINKALGK